MNYLERNKMTYEENLSKKAQKELLIDLNLRRGIQENIKKEMENEQMNRKSQTLFNSFLWKTPPKNKNK